MSSKIMATMRVCVRSPVFSITMTGINSLPSCIKVLNWHQVSVLASEILATQCGVAAFTALYARLLSGRRLHKSSIQTVFAPKMPHRCSAGHVSVRQWRFLTRLTRLWRLPNLTQYRLTNHNWNCWHLFLPLVERGVK